MIILTTAKKRAAAFAASTLLILFTGVGKGVAGTNMLTTGATTQPIGHYEFCKASPTECKAVSPNVAPHVVTRQSWAAIVDTNNAVNTRVAPLTDEQIWGWVEVWSYPTTVGDCEDYVLQKRKELMQKGFAANNLLITVVKQQNGEGHAVLTVRTDRGDFILDNLVGRINKWRDTPYKYLKRQSTEHAGRWVGIEDNRRQLASN